MRWMIPRQAGPDRQHCLDRGLKGSRPEGLRAIAYHTSKGGLVNFTRALAGRVGPVRHHRQCNLPGLHPVEDDARYARADRAARDREHADEPVGEPRISKASCVLLASAAARHITGRSSPSTAACPSVHEHRIPQAPSRFARRTPSTRHASRRWLVERRLGADALTIQQFSGGQSNPTYLLCTSGGRFVLRRKPPGALLPSAHAVDREFRIITALARQRRTGAARDRVLRRRRRGGHAVLSSWNTSKAASSGTPRCQA